MINSKAWTAGLIALLVGFGAYPVEAAKKATKGAEAPAQEGLLDGFEKADWQSYQAEGAVISLKAGPGKVGKGLQIVYDLKETKGWVQISKAFPIDSIRDKALELWIKGQGKANRLEVKLVDEDGTNFGYRKRDGTIAADWTQLFLNDDDFEYWWGGDDKLGAVKEIYIAISAGEGGAGQLSIDSLRLVPGKASELPADGILYDGESPEGWTVTQGEGGKISIGVGPGQTGRALILDYAMPANQWVAARRKIRYAFSAGDVFVFRAMGSGDANNLELKLVDKDDSAFGKVLNAFQGPWQEIRVPLADFKYLWGKNQQLDPSRILFLDVAISGPGGKGQVQLDQIQIVR